MRARLPLLLTLACVTAWFAIAAITWAGAAPLGHDESQYAIAARDALDGLPARWWFYLSRGMTAIAVPGVVLGEGERALRFVPLLIGGIGFAIAVCALARRAVGATAIGGVALLAMAASRNVVRYSTDLLSDFPAATCLVAALAVIVDEIDRADGPRRRIVAAAPLLAAAFYLRYGSVLPIAVIVLASVAVGARAIRRRPLPVLATAGVFLVLLVPHFIEATTKTGSPLGILFIGSEVPQEHYLGEGLVTYVASNPFKLYGLAIPVVLVAGIVGVRREPRRLLLWLVALGTLVAVGLTTHAQVRYVLLALAILAVLGVDALWRWLPGRARVPVAATGIAIAAILWALLARKHLAADENRTARMRATFAAVGAIRADAAGAPCTVLGYHYTQLEWYSRCRAPLVMSADFARAALDRGDRVYLVRDDGPTMSDASHLELRDFTGARFVILDVPGVVRVTRLGR